MATEIIVTDVFLDWYSSLTAEQQFPVKRVVSLLEEFGLTLPFPYSSSLRGTRYPLRELRTQAEGEPYRILYVFDPKRQAVLLLGGNKIGQGSRWYEGAIRQAEALWEEYRRDIGSNEGER